MCICICIYMFVGGLVLPATGIRPGFQPERRLEQANKDTLILVTRPAPPPLSPPCRRLLLKQRPKMQATPSSLDHLGPPPSRTPPPGSFPKRPPRPSNLPKPPSFLKPCNPPHGTLPDTSPIPYEPVRPAKGFSNFLGCGLGPAAEAAQAFTTTMFPYEHQRPQLIIFVFDQKLKLGNMINSKSFALECRSSFDVLAALHHVAI